MPNTIAHFALTSLLDKRIFSPYDLKWLFLGCIIPDVPWIAQRIVNASALEIDPYAIRAYFAVQASLMFCVFLSGFFAFQVRQSWRVFAILCVASLFHLLLDATQIKWGGNGVNLAAPFDWLLVQFGWFWPESIPTYLLTALGMVFFLYRFSDAAHPDPLIFQVSRRSRSASLAFLFVWIALPPVFHENLAQVDAHYLSTWKNNDKRFDKPIEFDRAGLLDNGAAQLVLSPYNETVELHEIIGKAGSTVSIKGYFSSESSIVVEEKHVHSSFRDYASVAGLSALAALWMVFLIRTFVSSKVM